MAFYVGWDEALQAVRKWADDTWGNINDPRNFQKLTGTFNYLMSDLNPKTINAEMQASSNASIYRPVAIRYIQHKGSSDLVTTDSSATCDAVDQRRDQLQTVQPDLFVMDKFTLDENYVRENAENGYDLAMRLSDEFRDCMRVNRESINDQLLSALGTAMGANPAQPAGAGTYTALELLKADGTLSADTFDVIKNDQEDNFSGGPIGIIGLGNARKAFNRLAVGNVNDGGVDFNEVASQFGMLLFKDSSITAQLGDADYVLAVYPGLTQFFQYTTNRGDFALNHGDLIKGTMPDPVVPGLVWDYDLSYSRDCDPGIQGGWTGRVWTYFDLYNVPEQAWGDTYSDLNDFNGIVGYDITQASS